MKLSPALLWLTWSVATAVMLFATSTPIHADFAPALLVLMVGTVGDVDLTPSAASWPRCRRSRCCSPRPRCTASTRWCCIWVSSRRRWLIGYLMRTQRLLLAEQIGCRRRWPSTPLPTSGGASPARCTTSSPTRCRVTLLHVTGARRALQQDRDVDDAVEALEQAEQLGPAGDGRHPPHRRTSRQLDRDEERADRTRTAASTTSPSSSRISSAPAWPSRCASTGSTQRVSAAVGPRGVSHHAGVAGQHRQARAGLQIDSGAEYFGYLRATGGEQSPAGGRGRGGVLRRTRSARHASASRVARRRHRGRPDTRRVVGVRRNTPPVRGAGRRQRLAPVWCPLT